METAKIVKINSRNISDINKANQPFEIIGKIKPEFKDGVWTYSEEIYEHSYMKTYSGDEFEPADYIDNPDKAIFFAYLNEECAGQIVLKKDWSRYVFIEDICVAKFAGRQGIGTALIQKAIEWAKDSGLNGLALETQDNNLAACRFYAKCGFVIGAVNTMLYKNFGNDEYAVFWYLKF